MTTMARRSARRPPPIRRGDDVVCGPKVLKIQPHRNSGPVVVFDVLFRLLRRGHGARGAYAANGTDVDDKINAKADEEGVRSQAITDRYSRQRRRGRPGAR